MIVSAAYNSGVAHFSRENREMCTRMWLKSSHVTQTLSLLAYWRLKVSVLEGKIGGSQGIDIWWSCPGPTYTHCHTVQSQTAASLHMASVGPPCRKQPAAGLLWLSNRGRPTCGPTSLTVTTLHLTAMIHEDGGSTAWSTVGEDNAKSPWSATEGGALPAHQYIPDAYFYAGDE